MIFGGLCRAIYQGIRGLCMYGLSNSRSPAQIVVRETPSVFTSKRPRSLMSRQRNVVKNCEVFSFRKPVDPVRSRSKQTGSLYSVAVEPADPMWSQNKRTEPCLNCITLMFSYNNCLNKVLLKFIVASCYCRFPHYIFHFQSM